jgi:hypothetical protein
LTPADKMKSFTDLKFLAKEFFDYLPDSKPNQIKAGYNCWLSGYFDFSPINDNEQNQSEALLKIVTRKTMESLPKESLDEFFI